LSEDLTMFSLAPYSLDQAAKDRFLTEVLVGLTRHHMDGCPSYRRMLVGQEFDLQKVTHYSDLPFLPVRLFKELDLRNIPGGGAFKTMTSSGTTGQAVSKIHLDKETAGNQQKALVRIVSDFIGPRRLPLLIVDSPAVVKDRAIFSARGAGILGFSIFGAEKMYALDDRMQLEVAGIRAFLEKHRGQTVLLFGFTFMVWKHLVQELLKLDEPLDLSRGILIHGGGWKKLAGEAVSTGEFKRQLQAVCGLVRIHDYYGMVEQAGSIFMECECGHLHASIYSDVIPRRAVDFSPCAMGETGILEVVSILPRSYPGHCLLTEDEGEIQGVDDCPCGRKGKYFKVRGRLENAEIRGCSDTYAVKS
jgi:hypothetical protein